MMYNLRDWHVFVLKSYFSKLSSLKPIKIKKYKQVILDFIYFSSEINPEDLEDLEDFISFKFKQNLEEYEFKIPYSKTQGKYLDILKRFLNSISTCFQNIEFEYLF